MLMAVRDIEAKRRAKEGARRGCSDSNRCSQEALIHRWYRRGLVRGEPASGFTLKIEQSCQKSKPDR